MCHYPVQKCACYRSFYVHGPGPTLSLPFPLQELLPLVLSFELPAIMQSDPSSPTVQHISQTYNLAVSFKPPTRLYRATGVVRGSQNNANAVKVKLSHFRSEDVWVLKIKMRHKNEKQNSTEKCRVIRCFSMNRLISNRASCHCQRSGVFWNSSGRFALSLSICTENRRPWKGSERCTMSRPTNTVSVPHFSQINHFITFRHHRGKRVLRDVWSHELDSCWFSSTWRGRRCSFNRAHCCTVACRVQTSPLHSLFYHFLSRFRRILYILTAHTHTVALS